MDGFTHESSHNKTIEWYTPKWIFDALGLRFDLDPCSPGKDVVPWIPADEHLTIQDDGLNSDWIGKVWLNPPYGQVIKKWMSRFAAHKNGIALVFNRTDTQWFQEYAAKADAICFISGRVCFIKLGETVAKGRSACGSMLLAFGDECVKSLVKSGLGYVVITHGKEG